MEGGRWYGAFGGFGGLGVCVHFGNFCTDVYLRGVGMGRQG
jgi:hypothetical protein